MDLIEKVVALVLEAIGLGYVGAPKIDRLALYKATVQAAAADGSTVDVLPESSRLDGMKGVRLRNPPGCVAVPKPGALVLIGWEAGDPSRVYAMPAYEAGAGFVSVAMAADTITLNGATYSLLQTETLLADLRSWVTSVNAVLASNCINGAPMSGYAAASAALTAFATSLAPGAAYKSTKVKNG